MFGFPSPVETEGIVARVAMVYGTPVVGSMKGALANTITSDGTGYRYPPGANDVFRTAIQRVFDIKTRLRANCLDAREQISIEQTIDQLADVY